MSFLSDLKLIAAGSSRAVGNSVELLAEGAVRLERVTGIMLTKQEISNLEQAIRFRVADGCPTIDLMASLDAEYGELQAKLDPEERCELNQRIESFRDSFTKLQMDKAIEAVDDAESVFAGRPDGAPYDEVEARRRLRGVIGDAIEMIGAARPKLTRELNCRRSALSNDGRARSQPLQRGNRLWRQRFEARCTAVPGRYASWEAGIVA